MTESVVNGILTVRPVAVVAGALLAWNAGLLLLNVTSVELAVDMDPDPSRQQELAHEHDD